MDADRQLSGFVAPKVKDLLVDMCLGGDSDPTDVKFKFPHEILEDQVVAIESVTLQSELPTQVKNSIHLFGASGELVKVVDSAQTSGGDLANGIYFASSGDTVAQQAGHKLLTPPVVIHPSKLPAWVESFALCTTMSFDLPKVTEYLSFPCTVETRPRGSAASMGSIDRQGFETKSSGSLFITPSDSAVKGTQSLIHGRFCRHNEKPSAWVYKALIRHYEHEVEADLLRSLGCFPCPTIPNKSQSTTLPVHVLGNKFSLTTDSNIVVFHLNKDTTVTKVQSFDQMDEIDLDEETQTLILTYHSDTENTQPWVGIRPHIPKEVLQSLYGENGPELSAHLNEDGTVNEYSLSNVARIAVQKPWDRPSGAWYPLAIFRRSESCWTITAAPQDAYGLKVNFSVENMDEKLVQMLLTLNMGAALDSAQASNENLVDLKFDSVMEFDTYRAPSLVLHRIGVESKYPGCKFSIVAYNQFGNALPQGPEAALIAEWALSKCTTGTAGRSIITLSLDDKVESDSKMKQLLQGKGIAGTADLAVSTPTCLALFADGGEKQRFHYWDNRYGNDKIYAASIRFAPKNAQQPLFFFAIRSRDDVSLNPSILPATIPHVVKRKFTLMIENGVNLKAMDSGGTSDPYVKGSIIVIPGSGSQTSVEFKTPVEKKTLNPHWGTRVEVPLNFASSRVKLDCIVWDQDLIGKDEIGRISEDITRFLDPVLCSAAPENGVRFELPLTDPKGKEPIGGRGKINLKVFMV
jgi:hypothetical protein